ncbi:MAG: flagellar basal body P-ring protein FlgI [Planctomycetales bacterium]|nr:flagellar basal body P-ring protein FlgI [Planctomycetales bacterium]
MNARHATLSTRRVLVWSGPLMLAACAAVGCMGPLLRHQSPDASGDAAEQDETGAQLISSVAHPHGLGYLKVESVALVTGLAGTGEDPAPSPQRGEMVAELNRREIPQPNALLASPNTALVVVRGLLRPGIQEGDRFDVEVRTPSRSDTKSLRSGWMLETSLTETAILGDALRKGHVTALAKGPILVDPSADGDSQGAYLTRGRILGGGVATKSRKLGLVLDHSHQSVRMSQLVGKAVNQRFFAYIEGQRRGVATPKTDEFIELDIHPRYKDNVGRYMRVVRNLALQESPSGRLKRLELLRSQLLDPVTAAIAAIRLEGMGDEDAIAALKLGAKDDDPEVRFYSAEALAYLDVTEGVEPLATAAREEPAFRVHALAALSTMQDGAASEALESMLKLKSAETRYGAFRALWKMSPEHPTIRGENLGGKFSYHIVDVPGPPMVHVTSSHRPEVVLFGRDHQLKLPLVVDAGERILVNGLSGAQITVSRFSPNEPTQQRTVSTNLDEVIRAVVELGGEYPDVVQMLQEAKATGALTGRFAVNALPEAGREFEDKDSSDDLAAQ